MNTQNSPRKKRRVLLLKGTGDSRKLLSVPSSPSASSLVQHPAPNRKKTRRTFSAKKRKHPLKWVSKGSRYAKLSGRASASSTTRTHGTCFDNSPKPQLTSSSPTRPMG